MIKFARIAVLGLALATGPLLAQDEGGGGEMIVVTGQRMSNSLSRVPIAVSPIGGGAVALDRRPVVGLRRAADNAVRHVEIRSDSREEDMRRSEVQAMLLAALDRAEREGVSLVTGTLEITVVTKANWKNLFPGLAGTATKVDDDDEDDDEDEGGRVAPGFEDDGSTATLRLMVRTKLTGSIADAQGKIGKFVKGVPATGRSEMVMTGAMALTIINPEQYRDEIYRRVAKAAQHAASFYGEGYGIEIAGLDRDIAWEQVSNTEVFLYIPYGFLVKK